MMKKASSSFTLVHMRHSRTRAHRSRLLTALIAVMGVTATLALPQSAVAAPASVLPVAATQAIAGAAAGGGAVDSAIVKTADLSRFNPGNIISDALFYDGNAMSAAEIQTFLDQKIGSCLNGKCLNIQNVSISSRDRRVSQVTGQVVCEAIRGGTMRASELIYRVQVACGISAKVILATLQKEQTLVTSRAPSDWNVQQAMGQACPDTAPCDPRFSGLGPQIVGGVNQLKIYKAGRFAKQPGVHYIQYNPDVRCGGSNVNIENYATAALYNYTPYQPNASSIRAGYGEGDTCGAYGNRNFFHFYNDWFGSSQDASVSPIVRVGTAIHVVSNGRRYHIGSDTWPAYAAAFGGPRVVTAEYLAGFADSGHASRVVRNSDSGEIAYLEAGQTHRFSTCGLVALWGEACADRVELSAADFARVRTGAPMAEFAKVAGDARRFLMTDGQMFAVSDLAALRTLNDGTAPYVAEMPSAVFRSYEISARTVYEPGALMRIGNASQVFLPTMDGKLIAVPSWALAAEMSLSTGAKYRVSSSAVAGYQKAGALQQFVDCAGRAAYGASGLMYTLDAGTPTGFASTSLDDYTCRGFKFSASGVAGSLFVRAAGTSAALHAVEGEYRRVANQAQLRDLNGGQVPRVLIVDPRVIDSTKIGEPYLASGTAIRSTESSTVWVVDGDSALVRLPSWAMASAYGISSATQIVGADAIERRSRDQVLQPFASCGGTTYLAAAGGLWPLASSTSSGGNAIVELSTSTCSALAIDAAAIGGPAFVSDGVRTAVATDGGFRWLIDEAAVLRANGGVAPSRKNISVDYGRTLPTSKSEPGSGEVIRVDGETVISLVDATRRLPLANLGAMNDLGIGARSRVVSSTHAANIAPAAVQLRNVVNCGGVDYVGARGVLHRVDRSALAGLGSVSLNAATCSTLDLGGIAITGALFVKAAGSTQVYVASDGGVRALSATETPQSVSGQASPTVLEIDARTLALLR